MSFNTWQKENNESLNEEYLENKYELEQMGESFLSFNEWLIEKWGCLNG